MLIISTAITYFTIIFLIIAVVLITVLLIDLTIERLKNRKRRSLKIEKRNNRFNKDLDRDFKIKKES